jgi:hypothetical protein
MRPWDRLGRRAAIAAAAWLLNKKVPKKVPDTYFEISRCICWFVFSVSPNLPQLGPPHEGARSGLALTRTGRILRVAAPKLTG